MRFVNEFLSNKDRLFRVVVLNFESDQTMKHTNIMTWSTREQIDPLYNRVAEKSNMLRAKEAIVRVEFDCCNDVEK